MKIRIGDCIGIVGTTGSGKSTLVDLIIGLHKPKSGSIYIDELNLCDSNVNSNHSTMWRKSIAYVPQNIYLIDASILENVAFGEPRHSIDSSRVIRALELSQLSSFIESLPDKEDTLVGESGVRLSGGQRQRIGIARALYKNLPILVLDEATSALDNETEQLIINSIVNSSPNLTIIMIAQIILALLV